MPMSALFMLGIMTSMMQQYATWMLSAEKSQENEVRLQEMYKDVRIYGIGYLVFVAVQFFSFKYIMEKVVTH